jgi:sugar phosphate isomerase/epimerase
MTNATAAPTIGLQLYTIRDAMTADAAAALERVAALGFTSVELYGLGVFGDAYAAGLAATGLTVCAAHVPIIGRDPLDPPDLERALDQAQALGVRTLIEPSTPAARWSDADEVRRMADTMNAAAAAAAARDIRVGYHNHDGEIRNRIGETSALEYFAGLLDPAVVLEIDAYWVVAGGEPLAPLVGRLGPRVRLMHVKDGSLEGDLATQPAAGTGEPPAHLAGQLPAGEGVVPLAEALDVATALEFAIVEFDVFAGDVFAGIAAGRRFLVWREGDGALR